MEFLENLTSKKNDTDDEDSDDSDEDDHNPIQLTTSEEDQILTIDLDKLNDDVQIVLNKNNTMYRVNSKLLSNVPNVTDGLYDIIRISLKKFGAEDQ